MGVEGRVFVEFVVNRDGSIVDVKFIKGIGAGCDEEAVRVVQSAPAWKPGKQRGKPVRQKMVIPIIFKLG
jgi:protein TonB